MAKCSYVPFSSFIVDILGETQACVMLVSMTVYKQALFYLGKAEQNAC